MRDISKIDRNFAFANKVERDDVVWYDACKDPFVLYGAYSANPYLRMPRDVAEKINPGVSSLCSHTAGVRVRFRCDSPYVAIRVGCRGYAGYRNITLIGQAGFSLYALTDDGDYNFLKVFVPPSSISDGESGYEGLLPTYGGMSDYILDFPLYNNVDSLFIGVKDGTKFGVPKGYKNEKPVVFYGSSITQGGCASCPSNAYQNFLSRWLNMHYINLGFSGSARAEDEMIEYLSSLDMSVFVSDYDHNAPSPEHLEATHFRLYEGIRAKHPTVPYIMISKPYFNNMKRSIDLRRREIIRTSYERAKGAGDKNVYFVDGETFFGDFERGAHTVDGVHPNDLGFYKMALALKPLFEKLI